MHITIKASSKVHFQYICNVSRQGICGKSIMCTVTKRRKAQADASGINGLGLIAERTEK